MPRRSWADEKLHHSQNHCCIILVEPRIRFAMRLRLRVQHGWIVNLKKNIRNLDTAVHIVLCGGPEICNIKVVPNVIPL
jgi:hypothetical protein